jgi:tripartite-type tricarboxylate transporter receptor subunit TctC
MNVPRRRFLHLAASAAALSVTSRIAGAEGYPTRPVHIISGFAAGAGGDTIARLIGQFLSERLGQQFIIENRTGAGGNLATEAVVKAPPDGYTLLLVTVANVVNTTLYERLSFDFARDIRPVASIDRVPNVMVVHPSFPAQSVPAFIAYAKANPGKINMASAGNGTAQHVAGEQFKMMGGINMTHVPYRGGAPALNDLIAGQVQVMFDHAVVNRVHQSRCAAPAGSDDGGACRLVAGHSDRGRLLARIREQLLSWTWRAQRYAHRHRRQTEQGGQFKPR